MAIKMMNDARADWAEEALAAFIAVTNTDRDDAIGDLLINLLHLAQRDGFTDLDALTERALRTYRAEVIEEADLPA